MTDRPPLSNAQTVELLTKIQAANDAKHCTPPYDPADPYAREKTGTGYAGVFDAGTYAAKHGVSLEAAQQVWEDAKTASGGTWVDPAISTAETDAYYAALAATVPAPSDTPTPAKTVTVLGGVSAPAVVGATGPAQGTPFTFGPTAMAAFPPETTVKQTADDGTLIATFPHEGKLHHVFAAVGEDISHLAQRVASFIRHVL